MRHIIIARGNGRGSLAPSALAGAPRARARASRAGGTQPRAGSGLSIIAHRLDHEIHAVYLVILPRHPAGLHPAGVARSSARARSLAAVPTRWGAQRAWEGSVAGAPASQQRVKREALSTTAK